MRISDWSSDVCSSDLLAGDRCRRRHQPAARRAWWRDGAETGDAADDADADATFADGLEPRWLQPPAGRRRRRALGAAGVRSEEHTSELQSLMRISYAVFCLKKQKKNVS